jgi:hypothetical protein
MKRLDLADGFRLVDLNGGNDLGARPQDQLVVGAVGRGGIEKIAVFGPNPFGVAVRDRREEQEPRRGESEPLLVDAALSQQHGLPAVEQRVHGRAPLLESRLVQSDRHARLRRARTSGRRSGGTVLGGCRRGCRLASSRVVVAVTSATASSKTSTFAPDGRVMPLTLRTYWREAASISSGVAAGSRPRSSVMFRHIPPR